MMRGSIKRPKPWPVKDVRHVEIALADLTTRHLQVEFDHGVRIVVVNEGQLPLAAQLIEHLRSEASSARNGGHQKDKKMQGI